MNAISAPATLTLCAGEDVTFVATGGGTEFLFYLDDNPIGVKTDLVYLQQIHLLQDQELK